MLSRYVDAIMIRTNQPRKARRAGALRHRAGDQRPDRYLASLPDHGRRDDLEEQKGPVAGKIVAWSGDGNNVAASWIHAAVRFGFELRLACPEELRPPAAARSTGRGAKAAGSSLTADPRAGGRAAPIASSPTPGCRWGSKPSVNRHNLLAPYRVDERLMAQAKPDAIFMHCLPAKRGEEVTAGVIDGPQSVVWDEAENRLHAQKGILAWCLVAFGLRQSSPSVVRTRPALRPRHVVADCPASCTDAKR